jgi:signal transduction histidine kinase
LRRPRDTYRGEFQTSDGQEWIFVAAPIRRPPSRFQLEATAVAAATPKSALGNALGDITPYLFGAGGVGLAVSLVAGLMLSRWFSRPLEHMTRAADEVARGDYSIKVPVDGPAETRRLAASFNQMTDAVQRSQQTLRDFLANASHELKTPLTAVSGFAQAMIDGTISDREGLVRSATVIETESRRVLHLVQEILDLHRLEAGQTKFSFGFVDIRELFSHVSEVFSLRAEETGVSLEHHVDGELAVAGDFDRLEQVLGNLVDNAFQHTARGGRVRLLARPVSADRVEVVVEDSGEGMPPEALDHIFERFFQVDGSTRRGTGLGLAITREIVRAHGGDIRAESVVGLGTRFFIMLPRATPAPRPGIESAPSAAR